MSLLQVRDLVVEFARRDGTLRALDGVSLDIAPGEILGVVGESGAGKSLLGAALLGLLEPPARLAGGQVLLQGERIDGLPEPALRRIRGRRIGAIFQDPLTALNPLYTVGQQLVQTLRTHLPLTAPQARVRAIQLLEDVGIAGAASRLSQYPHQFSGGMRQRVVMALALAAEPQLVIADEPTTALDVSVQAQVMGLLRSICRARGAAVLLITHDMGVIAETCDRVVVLYAGRVVESGPTAQLVGQPRHPYTAGLMAAIPDVHRDVDRLAHIPGAMPRLDAMPAGCAFYPRCAQAHARCRTGAAPVLATQGHARVACWLHVQDTP